MFRISIYFIVALVWFSDLYAQVEQDDSVLHWYDPMSCGYDVVEGQWWSNAVSGAYDRLPSKAQGVVRDDVWNLSKHAAGMMIRLWTDAEQINVRYVIRGRTHMEHMPATGVSGLDLYRIDSDGQWSWCRGLRHFSDTITYHFGGLVPDHRYHDMGNEYRLYLPLYAQVEWLEIGVLKEDKFEILPIRKDAPIVVYGTSIAQGACASRPGMAWANILSRSMDRPLINLAFSGNGRLENEVVTLLTEIDAKIFVIDCLPNLTDSLQYNDEELMHRIIYSVNQLRRSRPNTPILLTEHAGYTDGFTNPKRLNRYTRVNRIQRSAFAQLRMNGIDLLYYLSSEEIGLGLDDMTDGTHPNDLGMMHYAKSYERILRSILDEPIGDVSTTTPCVQSREPGNYNWEERHRLIKSLNIKHPPEIVILANSIIHFWGGLPRASIARDPDTWARIFTPMGIRNMAFGWDRIENTLWRVYHGELDGIKANTIFIMIGTNNLHLNTDDEILEGHKYLIQAIQSRQEGAQITIFGLLPRRNFEKRIALLNQKIARLSGTLNIRYRDIGRTFLNDQGKLEESLFSDGLHPNEKGYKKLAEELLPLMR